MYKLTSGAVFALLATNAAAAQDTVTWQDNIEGWTVVIDRTIENSCFIVSGFENDTLLRFQFNATERNVQFIIANVNWKSLEDGQHYDLEVAFGESDPWEGQAEGHRWNEILPSLVLSVPVDDRQASHFMTEFTAMDTVRITHGGAQLAHLALTGTGEAVDAMLDCQATMSNANAASDNDVDPFATEEDPV